MGPLSGGSDLLNISGDNFGFKPRTDSLWGKLKISMFFKRLNMRFQTHFWACGGSSLTPLSPIAPNPALRHTPSSLAWNVKAVWWCRAGLSFPDRRGERRCYFSDKQLCCSVPGMVPWQYGWHLLTNQSGPMLDWCSNILKFISNIK